MNFNASSVMLVSRNTIFFMLVVPVLQTLIFGVAIDTQIEHIPLVVHDLDGKRAARER